MGRSSPRSRLKGHLLGTSGAPQGHLQGVLDVPKVSQNLASVSLSSSFTVSDVQMINPAHADARAHTHADADADAGERREELVGIAFNRLMKMSLPGGDHLTTWRYNTVKVFSSYLSQSHHHSYNSQMEI